MTPVERPAPRYLAHTSLVWRLLFGTVGDPWPARVTEGLVTICPVAHAELRHGLRPGVDPTPFYLALDQAFGSVPMKHFNRQPEAADVAKRLRALGIGRLPSLMDIVTALTARDHGLTLVHTDDHFEAIGQVCPGIPMIKVVADRPPRPAPDPSTRRRGLLRSLLDD
ncbi:PIN domain nuclease [Streptomyces qinzhouensis]|uniref:PIN domain nuclease n=1 Tax=Streptomyces qinzhouensis TaxID=2599401 RepID=A0A5B8JE65_9ACTN|nr:PIN domain nuclease [Streptomyces qinzhouensis]QDY80045.1 PIN domain nuclease [Streptomyces qinzhouensis]